MINKTIGYTSSDGEFHATLKEAQQYELVLLLAQTNGSSKVTTDGIEMIATDMLENADKFIDILTMKPNSLPKARKINGGTKKRTPKHIADQNVLPLEAK